ncbi:MAG: mannose-6-phosphate isomerase [Pirellulaceae bacterium]|nr:MAG: mannose-6-phosphate isomerase [Pirellulaceae bacterium]
MDTPQPYPLRFEPFFQSYLWGGRKLGTVLGKPIPPDGVWAESWEVVEHPEHTSRIENGRLKDKTIAQVRLQTPQWLMGEAKQQWDRFPLLLKYLDCQQVLSVQVHPDDAYAAEHLLPDHGKTEAWYIIDAEPGAKIYAGLIHGTTRAMLLEALAAGTVDQLLHTIEPQAGDTIFIPAGTVHALGAGLLVAEIQQSSNATFRLFDWNRVDKDGKPRPLHIEQALEVIDFEAGPRSVQIPQALADSPRERLVTCNHFILDRLTSSTKTAGDGRFHILTIPQGQAVLHWREGTDVLARGATTLLPAAHEEVTIELNESTVVLDMYLP